MEKNNNFSRSYFVGELSYGFWDTFAKIIGVINTFFIISSLTRYEYGSFQLLLSSYSGLAVLLGVGGGVVANDIIRYEAEGRNADAKKLFYEIFYVKIAIGFLLLFATFCFTPFLSAKYGPDYISLIRIISFLFIHDALLGVMKVVLEMRKMFNFIASRTSVAKIAQLVILLYFYFFNHVNLRAVVISLVGSLFVTLALLVPQFLKAYSPWSIVKKSSNNFLIKIMTSHGKWGIFQQITGKITPIFEAWSIKLFINTEAVAIYSVAQTIVGTIAGFLPTKTLAVLVPLEIKNEEKLKKIYTYGMKYLVAIATLSGLVAYFTVPILIDFFFKKYIVSMPYFKVLLLTLPMLAIMSMSSIFFVAFRKQKFAFFQKVLKTVISIPLYLLLLPMLGLWGLVVHNFIITFVMVVSVYVYMKNMTPRLFVNLHDMVVFGKEDMVFLSGFLENTKKVFLRFKNKF
ncbi:MAG: oligosaccharide flippase family protein [Parcubacteria group bacterium]